MAEQSLARESPAVSRTAVINDPEVLWSTTSRRRNIAGWYRPEGRSITYSRRSVMRVLRYSALIAVAGFTLASAKSCISQSNLQITYGSQGIQTLSYQGKVLEDISQNASDAFHIWHMKMTDLSGTVST